MNKADFKGYFKNIQQTQEDVNTDEVWKMTKEHLKLMLGNRVFLSLFNDVYIENIGNGIVQFTCDSEFKKEKILRDYKASLRQALKKVTGANYEIEINVQRKVEEKDGYEYHDPTENKTMDLFSESKKEQETLEKKTAEAHLNPKYLFSNFVVGKSNELAEAVAEAVVKDLGNAYNPVFFYGNSGLGKTHLMQAIGNEVLKNDPTKKVVYIPIEQFLNEMVDSIKTKRNEDFRNKYRTVDLLIIDDVQFVEEFPRTQEELFHTFNALYQTNKQIVLASDRSPQEIKNITDRLRTRFMGGMVADIQPPDYETRLAILKQNLEEKDAKIPEEYLELIAKNIESDIRQLEGALTKVVSLYKLGLKPTEEDVAKMLQIDLDSKRKKITPAKVISAVSEVFDVKPSEIKGNRRTAYVAQCRQVVMYILRKELELPLERVAREVNRKDHTTVIHAYEKIEKKEREDAIFREKLDSCLHMIRS
ncbi:TPA: chromosomal replication initiator protein DnaA [Candidatus Dojkabacteria bacterium]|uniref:Chromosomal replication initiator protein DnaA n=1 Tax=Candidatus Dojkabacteria bacterium TaxID=2099670 RepID=A0A832QED3_9BACT|nr:chromosomal replication initiator protein DnaA [Candidatus Dojkabacteria bacterium]